MVSLYTEQNSKHNSWQTTTHAYNFITACHHWKNTTDNLSMLRASNHLKVHVQVSTMVNLKHRKMYDAHSVVPIITEKESASKVIPQEFLCYCKHKITCVYLAAAQRSVLPVASTANVKHSIQIAQFLDNYLIVLKWQCRWWHLTIDVLEVYRQEPHDIYGLSELHWCLPYHPLFGVYGVHAICVMLRCYINPWTTLRWGVIWEIYY